MFCYRDMSFCADASICAVSDEECERRLTKEQSDLAKSHKMPIAWMNFKDICAKFKELPCPLTK